MKSWIGTIQVGKSVRVVYNGVERERVWKSMIRFLDRCDALSCLVSLTREDYFVARPTDVGGHFVDGDGSDQISPENNGPSSRPNL